MSEENKTEVKVNLEEVMFEAIQLIPYINSNKKLHRIYRAPMINVIKMALLAANTKLTELDAYKTRQELTKTVVLDTVKKEEPKE